MSNEKDCCDIVSELSLWFAEIIGHGIRRPYYSNIPTPPKHQRGPCKLPYCYVWFQRNDTFDEECVEIGNDILADMTGYPAEPSTDGELEVFDVEIWGADMHKVECLARQIREQTPYTSRPGSVSPVFQSIVANNQADDYTKRGIHSSYFEGGAQVATMLLEVSHSCDKFPPCSKRTYEAVLRDLCRG